ncbi:hypothetical protein DFH11DRAFT_1591418 [Phellopilus nigrolimitatus]|nr:hypothetical protein DFH11DRAFT_1591418 [Phellopilus nigrolimitatus]
MQCTEAVLFRLLFGSLRLTCPRGLKREAEKVLSLTRLGASTCFVSGNCPPHRQSELEYYAMLSKPTVHH